MVYIYSICNYKARRAFHFTFRVRRNLIFSSKNVENATMYGVKLDYAKSGRLTEKVGVDPEKVGVDPEKVGVGP